MSPLQTVSISVGHPKSCDGLADLWVASWQETMPAIDFSLRRPWIVERLRTWPKDGLLVANADEIATGFLLLDASAGLIDQIVVAPAFKGQGIAGSLVEAARRLTQNDLVLDVNADNLRAIRFYERHGFRVETAGLNAASGLPTWRMRTAKADFRGR